VVVITTAWNGRIYDAVVKHKKNFVIVWDGQALDLDCPMRFDVVALEGGGLEHIPGAFGAD